MNPADIKRESAETLQALRTLDLAWARSRAEPAAKARGWAPPDDETLLASMHKARTVHPAISEEMRVESWVWLREHNMGGFGASWGEGQ